MNAGSFLGLESAGGLLIPADALLRYSGILATAGDTAKLTVGIVEDYHSVKCWVACCHCIYLCSLFDAGNLAVVQVLRLTQVEV